MRPTHQVYLEAGISLVSIEVIVVSEKLILDYRENLLNCFFLYYFRETSSSEISVIRVCSEILIFKQVLGVGSCYLGLAY